MSSLVNSSKANRFAHCMGDPCPTELGKFFDEAAVFGFYGPVRYNCDFKGIRGKGNAAWHLSIIKKAIKPLEAWCPQLSRKLTKEESQRAFEIPAGEYYKLHHKVEPTKVYLDYGHSTAVFLVDKQAINGQTVRNWTKPCREEEKHLK
eukprot:1527395-Amphidinium_carterae.1